MSSVKVDCWLLNFPVCCCYSEPWWPLCYHSNSGARLSQTQRKKPIAEHTGLGGRELKQRTTAFVSRGARKYIDSSLSRKINMFSPAQFVTDLKKAQLQAASQCLSLELGWPRLRCRLSSMYIPPMMYPMVYTACIASSYGNY